MLNTLRRLAGACEFSGDYEQALVYVRQIVEMEPWQEEAHQQVMRLLVFTEQRSNALLQYESCKKLLASELGVDPSPQTTRLYESIRDESLSRPFQFTLPAIPEYEERSSFLFLKFVARDEELRQLNLCLENALTGEGRVVFVNGEAGSGKTHLVKEFLSRSTKRYANLVAVYSNCNAFTGKIDPYLPFIEVLKMLAGDVELQWATGIRDRAQLLRLWSSTPALIDALVEIGPDLIGRFIPGEQLLAHSRILLSKNTNRLENLVRLSAGSRSPAGPGMSHKRQSELFEQVVRLLKAVAHAHPMILALDDLQWADPDTLNLLFYLCRRLSSSHILVIGAYRQEAVEMDATGISQSFVTFLHELQSTQGNPEIDLSRSNARAFVDALLDCEPNALGNDFRETLLQHTSGIPLFTVELMRGMLERRDLVRNVDGRWVDRHELDWNRLSPRIEAVIAEKVNRLPPEWQAALSAASVEGDLFTSEVIAKVQAINPDEFVEQLSGPLSKKHRIVFAAGSHGVGRSGKRVSLYRFRHHLFQQYFYSRQDMVERARLHEAVGNALETLYGEQAVEIALPLAFHFESAGMREKAARYLLQAGQQAVHLCANEEALAHFRKGLALLGSLPETQDRDRLELQLQLAQGTPLIALQGYTSSALERAYSRARRLVERSGNQTDLFWVLSVLKSYYNLRGDPSNSKIIAKRMLHIAKSNQNPDQMVTAYSRMVSNSIYYGRLPAFRKYLNQTLRLYDLEKHRSLIYQVGGDPKGIALEWGCLGAWISGYPDQARQYCLANLAFSKELSNSLCDFFAYYYAALFHVYTQEIKEAQHWAEQAWRVSSEQNMAHYCMYADCVRGWTFARQGDLSGIDLLEQGAVQVREVGDRMNLLQILRMLVDALYTNGLYAQGLNCVDEALVLSGEIEVVYDEPELYRLKGEITRALSPGNQLKAEGCFLLAIKSAVSQGAKMWELRAVVSLSRLLYEHGRQEEALVKLKAIYDWFNEGLDTKDLIEARHFLDVMALKDAKSCI